MTMKPIYSMRMECVRMECVRNGEKEDWERGGRRAKSGRTRADTARGESEEATTKKTRALGVRVLLDWLRGERDMGEGEQELEASAGAGDTMGSDGELEALAAKVVLLAGEHDVGDGESDALQTTEAVGGTGHAKVHAPAGGREARDVGNADNAGEVGGGGDRVLGDVVHPREDGGVGRAGASDGGKVPVDGSVRRGVELGAVDGDVDAEGVGVGRDDLPGRSARRGGEGEGVVLQDGVLGAHVAVRGVARSLLPGSTRHSPSLALCGQHAAVYGAQGARRGGASGGHLWRRGAQGRHRGAPVRVRKS